MREMCLVGSDWEECSSFFPNAWHGTRCESDGEESEKDELRQCKRGQLWALMPVDPKNHDFDRRIEDGGVCSAEDPKLMSINQCTNTVITFS